MRSGEVGREVVASRYRFGREADLPRSQVAGEDRDADSDQDPGERQAEPPQGGNGDHPGFPTLSRTGTSMVARTPPSARLAKRTSPPHSLVSSRAIASPSPVPPGPSRPAAPRRKRSNTASSSPDSSPKPSSLISISPPRLLSLTTEPEGEY